MGLLGPSIRVRGIRDIRHGPRRCEPEAARTVADRAEKGAMDSDLNAARRAASPTERGEVRLIPNLTYLAPSVRLSGFKCPEDSTLLPFPQSPLRNRNLDNLHTPSNPDL